MALHATIERYVNAISNSDPISEFVLSAGDDSLISERPEQWIDHFAAVQLGFVDYLNISVVHKKMSRRGF